MGRFAEKTRVPVGDSQREIERILRRYGADGFMAGWDNRRGFATLAFRCNERQIRFELPMPKRADFKGSEAEIERLMGQQERQRWRALVLVVKAKLEAVESQIATFDQEFMAHVVLPNGRTVSEMILPQIAQAHLTGRMPPLLGASSVDGEVLDEDVR
jgi:hypothetical protein